MPQGLAARILGILDGLINPKSYDPPITRGDLIKYDDSITFDGLNSVGPVNGLGNQFGVGGRIENQTLYLQGANNDLGTPRPGLMTTGTQSISGQKTFLGNITVEGTFYSKSTILFLVSTTHTFTFSTANATGNTYVYTNSAGCTITLNLGTAPVGSNINFINAGTGILTFVGAAIVSENGWKKVSVQNTAATATILSGTQILLTGNLSP